MGSCCTAERSQGVVAPEGPGASCTARVPSGRGQERGALCCQAVPSPGIVPPEVSWHPLVCVLSLINIPISTYLFIFLPQPVLHCQMRTQILHSHSSVVQVCFPVNCCGKFLLIVLNLRGRSPSLIHWEVMTLRPSGRADLEFREGQKMTLGHQVCVLRWTTAPISRWRTLQFCLHMVWVPLKPPSASSVAFHSSRGKKQQKWKENTRKPLQVLSAESMLPRDKPWRKRHCQSEAPWQNQCWKIWHPEEGSGE